MTESSREATASLVNISLSGCLLLFQSEEIPQEGESLQINVCLPGSAYRFDLFGSVKNVSEFRGTARCGIEFAATRSREFLAQQQQISRYVMKRQSECI